MVSQKNIHPQSSKPQLDELAALYGVSAEYRDSKGRQRTSSPESLHAVLAAMGAEVDVGRMQGGALTRVEAAIRARKAELDARLVEPVLIASDGVMPRVLVRPPKSCRGRVDLTLTLEGGGERRWRGTMSTPQADGCRAAAVGWEPLPLGYHRLHVQVGTSTGEATLISAPRACWAPEHKDAREWGVFAPLYALRSERDWGAGDLTDLEALGEAVGAVGGSAISLLPLLAAFLDDPFEPAPYRPISRLFWNEFYLAVDRIAEWERCAEAREIWVSADVQSQIDRLRTRDLVDYGEIMTVKRRVLERLEQCFHNGADRGRTQAFAEYVRSNPHVNDYAVFRVRGLTGTRQQDVQRYHLYCQWQMEEQMAGLARRHVPGLFLDMPVGVHPKGFDTWRWPGLFAEDMSFGAPPDSFFAKGQDWDSRPLLPAPMRAEGHRYFARCLSHHMRYARYLRVDHIMALHRLYWIPEGAAAVDGVYVDYPAEELYAVLCLESWRNRTVVVGEDLGTVPPGVRASMRRHGVLGTWVFQASIRPRAADPVKVAPRHVVASLGTHDMVPFAGFLRGVDIDARLRTGQVDDEGARREIAARHGLIDRLSAWLRAWAPAPVKRLSGLDCHHDPEGTLLKAALAHMALSPAALVMVNLDDLLLGTEPQNLPGTGPEEPNWRRRIPGTQTEVHEAIAWAASLFSSCGRPALTRVDVAGPNGRQDSSKSNSSSGSDGCGS